MFIQLPKKAQNLAGRVFGQLRALGPVEIRRYVGATHVIWLCQCKCGKQSKVAAGRLRSGQSRSCGCMKAQWCAEANLLHGHSRRAEKLSRPEYRIWCHMRARCLNETDHAFRLYGGRGIKICQRWDSFAAFYADMGPRPSPNHSIDRTNRDGDYEPSNCRWATISEQNNNTSRNRRLRVGDREMTLAQWSRETGVHEGTIRDRLKDGVSVDTAIRKGRVPRHPRFKKQA